jgi:hypothetical protein
MHPFTVTIPEVSDPDLGPLLTRLADAGYPNPVVQSMDEGGLSSPKGTRPAAAEGDLPTAWTKVRELDDQSYSWPQLNERYTSYAVYNAETDREGSVNIALGLAERYRTWGRDREYVIAFLTSGAPQVPLVEFLETDDYKETGKMIAVIRGRDGSRKMYGPGDSLPDIYSAAFETVTYNDYIRAPGSWNKVAVLAHKDDYTTMLNHALVQARRRGDL